MGLGNVSPAGKTAQPMTERRYHLPVLPVLLACAPRLPPPAPDLPPPPPLTGPIRVQTPRLEGAVLFADELHPVEDAVARFLAERGYSVLSRAEQEAIIAQTADCPSPPIPARLLSHRLPDTATAQLGAACAPDCTLTLTTFTEPTLRPWGVTARWEAPLSGPPTLSAVLAAIPALLPVEDASETGVVGAPATREVALSRGVATLGLQVAGGWSTADLSAALAGAGLDGCWASGRRDPRQNPIVFSLDADGAVTRCEPSLPRVLPEPESDCLCAVLAGQRLGAGAADRRGAFDPESHQPPAVNAAGQLVSATLGTLRSELEGLTLAGAGIGAHDLAACLSRVDRADNADIPVRFLVGADGVPTAAEVSWPTWAAEAEACLDALLPQARFSCLTEGEGGAVEATVRIRVR
jgi:hypothetical protein